MSKLNLIYSRLFAFEGAYGLVTPEFDGCYVSNEYPTFDCDRNRLLPEYLRLYFKRPTVWQDVARLSTGMGDRRRRVQPDQFLTHCIPLPPLPEQRRIVAKVDELAAKIEEAKWLRAKSIDQSRFVVSSESSAVFVTLMGSLQKRLGELGFDNSNPIQTGPFGAQLHKSEFVEAGIPVLNVGNVDPNGLILSPLDYVLPEKAAQLSRYSLRPDDLLFARSGATLGKVCLVPNQCDGWLMTGHLFRVRLDTARCLPSFAFVAFRGARSVRDQVFAQVRGATRPGFNTTFAV